MTHTDYPDSLIVPWIIQSFQLKMLCSFRRRYEGDYERWTGW